jgi:hypothetical protein
MPLLTELGFNSTLQLQRCRAHVAGKCCTPGAVAGDCREFGRKAVQPLFTEQFDFLDLIFATRDGPRIPGNPVVGYFGGASVLASRD